MGVGGLRRSLIAAVFCMLVTAAPAAARAPEDFGRFEVRVTRVEIPVPPDPRGPEGALPTVAADVYVPAGRRRPSPLVQLSHGWPGTLREFPLSGWGRRLASRGFVVIVSDRRGGSSLAVAPQLGQPADVPDLSSDVNSEDILRVVRWALAESRGDSFLHGRVDRRRIAIGGHSLGGYFATFAAVKAQSEGPRLDALLLLDPSDERLGQYTLDSSLVQTPFVEARTLVLDSEENQHPVQCNMDDGPDCTLVAPQQYGALSDSIVKLGVKVVGAVHEDIEDPSTIGTPESVEHLRTYQRYGMAWLEFFLARDCRAAPYLGGAAAQREAEAGTIEIYPGATAPTTCRRRR